MKFRGKLHYYTSSSFNLENGTESLSRNVGKGLPLLAE